MHAEVDGVITQGGESAERVVEREAGVEQRPARGGRLIRPSQEAGPQRPNRLVVDDGSGIVQQERVSECVEVRRDADRGDHQDAPPRLSDRCASRWLTRRRGHRRGGTSAARHWGLIALDDALAALGDADEGTAIAFRDRIAAIARIAPTTLRGGLKLRQVNGIPPARPERMRYREPGTDATIGASTGDREI